MYLDQYTENIFIETPPESGITEILVSGTLSPFATWNSGSEKWDYDTGSWNWGNPVSGNLSASSSIIGVKISNIDKSGKNNLNSFKLCKDIAFTVQIGDQNVTVLSNILDKKCFSAYTWFKVNFSLDSEIRNINITFKSGSDDIFLGYDCGEIVPILVSVNPRWTRETLTVFNPIINNVADSVKNSVTRLVELGTVDYLTGQTPEYIWDAEAASGSPEYDSSSISGSGLNGKDANPEDDIAQYPPNGIFKKAFGGSAFDGALRLYHITQNTVTVPASIPDSFYTSVANISGRFLGAKNAYSTRYTGYKQRFTNDNLSIASASSQDCTGSISLPNSGANIIITGQDRPFFTLQTFSGSVFPSDADVTAIESMSLSDMVIEPLKFAAGAFLADLADSGSAIKVKAAGNLPGFGDILYSSDGTYRLTNRYVYVPDLNKTFYTNNYGHISQSFQ